MGAGEGYGLVCACPFFFCSWAYRGGHTRDEQGQYTRLGLERFIQLLDQTKHFCRGRQEQVAKIVYALSEKNRTSSFSLRRRLAEDD